MSGSRNENLEILHNLVREAFAIAGDNATLLGALNRLDSYCNELQQDISLDAKKALVSEMKKEITTVRQANSNLYNEGMKGLNGLIMDYALAQAVERRTEEESKRNADIDARQSSRVNKANPHQPPPVRPSKSKSSFGIFSKSTVSEPESIKKVNRTPKSAPAEMVTTPKIKK